MLFRKGLASAAHDAFASPGMVLAVFAITTVSAGFHEFGHAAALRRGGGTPGAMGAGLYLIYPAFYTDVTDSYRLSRGARLRTDLGGLYFNAIMALAMFGLWAAVGWDGLLLVIATQILQMIRQLPPLVRFDGYHILADLTGVPDLFQRIKPTIVGLWPTRWRQAESQALRPWARLDRHAVGTARRAADAADGAHHRADAAAHRRHRRAQPAPCRATCCTAAGSPATGSASAHGRSAVVAVALPLFGVLYMLTRTVRRLATSTWKRTAGHPAKRTVALVTAAAVVAALTWAWWPRGNYRPIQANERGTIQQAVQQIAPASYTSQSLRPGQRLAATTVWAGSAAAHAAAPGTAVVSHRNRVTARRGCSRSTSRRRPGSATTRRWPSPRKDGSTVYDVAFALVWANSSDGAEQERGVRVRELHRTAPRSRSRSRSCSSSARRTSSRRRTSRPRSATTACAA